MNLSSIPRTLPHWTTALTLALVFTALLPHSAAGAEPPATQKVEGSTLVLQGKGTRYRTIFKVYEMALYLPQKAQTAQEALRLSGPVRINFSALRDLPGTDLGLSFIRGLQKNATPEQMQRYTAASNRLIEIFSGRSKVANGETFAMEFGARQGHHLLYPRRAPRRGGGR